MSVVIALIAGAVIGWILRGEAAGPGGSDTTMSGEWMADGRWQAMREED